MEADLSGSTSAGSEPISLPFYDTQRALQSAKLPADIEKEILKLPYLKQESARDKIRRFGDAVQPHTDEGGTPHYIGSFYGPVDPDLLGEWKQNVVLEPYMQYLQALSKKLPHVEYLFLWMLVGCSPLKWRFLKHFPQSRAERVARTKVSIVEYYSNGSVKERKIYDRQALRAALLAPVEDTDVRLFVVEDLSRDVVESLGSHFQIDPTFFLSHINNYRFHKIHDRWGLPPDIQLTAQQNSHLNIDSIRAHWFANEDDFEVAERESGMFNVLRRLDGDRSRKLLRPTFFDRDHGSSVSLGRSKTSFWWRPAEAGAPVTGILLVDPTVSTGLQLWGGNRSFEPPPSMDEVRALGEEAVPDPRSSLFEEVIHQSCRLSKHDLIQVKTDPRALLMPALKIVIAEWLTYFKYMSLMIGDTDQMFEKPYWGREPTDYDELFKKMSPWRRDMHYYQWMIRDSITNLFSQDTQPRHPSTIAYVGQLHECGIAGLKPDFELLQQRMDHLDLRIRRLWDTSSNAVAVEDARRALRTNQNNSGQVLIGILATIFLPLNFATSFLSMSADFPVHNTTFWLFFAIGVPFLGLTVFVVILVFPGWRRYLKWA